MNVSICRTKKCIIIGALSWVSKINCLMVVVHGNAKCENQCTNVIHGLIEKFQWQSPSQGLITLHDAQ